MSNAQQEKLLQSAAVAAREGSIDELGHILRQSPEVLDARDSEGQTLLILACKAAPVTWPSHQCPARQDNLPPSIAYWLRARILL
jgi:hypothetical protein